MSTRLRKLLNHLEELKEVRQFLVSQLGWYDNPANFEACLQVIEGYTKDITKIETKLKGKAQ